MRTYSTHQLFRFLAGIGRVVHSIDLVNGASLLIPRDVVSIDDVVAHTNDGVAVGALRSNAHDSTGSLDGRGRAAAVLPSESNQKILKTLRGALLAGHPQQVIANSVVLVVQVIGLCGSCSNTGDEVA